MYAKFKPSVVINYLFSSSMMSRVGGVTEDGEDADTSWSPFEARVMISRLVMGLLFRISCWDPLKSGVSWTLAGPGCCCCCWCSWCCCCGWWWWWLWWCCCCCCCCWRWWGCWCGLRMILGGGWPLLWGGGGWKKKNIFLLHWRITF